MILTLLFAGRKTSRMICVKEKKGIIDDDYELGWHRVIYVPR